MAAALALSSFCSAADVEKERAEVPEAAAVSAAGVRYQAPSFTRTEGLPRNGAYVEAIDEASGVRLWIVEVVAPPADDDREQDKRDVFISKLELLTDGRTLLVIDERGRVYVLDLETLRVRKGDGMAEPPPHAD